MASKAKLNSFLNKAMASLVAGTIALGAITQPVFACGPFYDEAMFSFTIHPDMPYSLYADGKLAIVEPTYARSYLYAAYRYFEGKPLSSSEKTQLLNLWRFRLGKSTYEDGASSSDSWLKARAKTAQGLTGLDKVDSIYPYRFAGSESEYDPFLNCNDDSFKQATKTLQEKVTKFGAGSAQVKEWLSAQDKVFCHCGSPQYDYEKKVSGKEPSFPAPAPEGASAEVKHERAYQIAAANFYAKNFDTAAKEFGLIALDATSPYQKISAYLVARCLIRKATVSTSKGIDHAALQAAHSKLVELHNDPAMSSFKEGLASLLKFVGLRLDPSSTLIELSKRLASGSDESLYEDMDGYLYILDNAFKETSEDAISTHKVDDVKLAAAMHGDPMTDWIWTFSSDDKESGEHALARYREHKNEAWLLCVGSKLKGSEAHAAEILAALAKVEKSSPAFVTASYQRASVLMAQGHKAEAASAIEGALSATRAPSAVNALNLLKLKMASSLDHFLSLSYAPPALIVGDAEQFALAEQWDKADKDASKANNYVTLPVVLRPQAATTLNQFLPMTLFLQSAQSERIPTTMRKDFAQAAFCRAILLHDQTAASQASALLKKNMPSVATLIAKYDSAAADSKEFAAAFYMLKNPGARPYLTGGVARTSEFNHLDDYADNWWNMSSLSSKEKQLGDFLKPADIAKAKAELAAMVAPGTGPDYLGNVVIDYARKHLTDASVPEALAMVVKATKLGSTDSKTSAVSKSAFQILHTNFKGNPWTVKTPYYY